MAVGGARMVIDIMDEGCPCMGKNLDRLLQPSILMFLTKQDMYGFILIKKLGESPMFKGSYPDPSGLYRYLKKMESMGLLASYVDTQKDAPDRTVYRITEEGKGCLLNWMNTLIDYDERLRSLIGMIKDEADNDQ